MGLEAGEAELVDPEELDFADFALEFLDDFFGFYGLNLQGVQPFRRSELQLDHVLQPLYSTIAGLPADLHEPVHVKDFGWHCLHPVFGSCLHPRRI